MRQIYLIIVIFIIASCGKSNQPPSFNVDSSEYISCSSLTPTLTWSKATDPEDDLLRYSVYLGSSEETMNQIASGLTNPNYQVTTALNYSTEYFWRVDVTDETTTVSSLVRTFTTISSSEEGKIPNSAIIVEPKDNNIVDSSSPIFSWEHTTDGKIIEYELFIRTTSARVFQSIGKTSELTIKLSTLSPADYLWFVTATDSDGNSSQSSTEYFTVI